MKEITFMSGESLEEVISIIEDNEGWIYEKSVVTNSEEFSLFFVDGKDHIELQYVNGGFLKQRRYNSSNPVLEIDAGGS